MGAGLESQSRRDSVLEELGRSVCWDLVEGQSSIQYSVVRTQFWIRSFGHSRIRIRVVVAVESHSDWFLVKVSLGGIQF